MSGQFSPGRFVCPNCGCASGNIIERKFLVTQLRRCDNCQLMYRTPTDDPALNAEFYDCDYTQGFTTDVPSEVDLAEFKSRNFAGTEKDYSYYIGVLAQLGINPGAKLFDFGCSWGYGSYQFSRAGYLVTSFEIAKSRRSFAQNKLGVHTVDDMEQVSVEFADQFDCFFSAHVLEHVPSPALAIGYAGRLLKAGGLFVSFTPNGSTAHKDASSDWSKLWGQVHPNLIDDIFLDNTFTHSPRTVGTSPVTAALLPSESVMTRLDRLAGGELFFASRKVNDSWDTKRI